MKASNVAAGLTAAFLVSLGAYSLNSAARVGGNGTLNAVTIDWAKTRSAPSGTPSALLVPVKGVSRASLKDSWGAAREGGRRHHGIDIMAPKGTPVWAATDGKVIKLDTSVRGGTAIYQQDASGRVIFYYAHLDRYAPGLVEGQKVRQGETIGFVGKTGNAPIPHLHFEIQKANEKRQWWSGAALNPFPILRSGKLDAVVPASFARLD
ncbi:MAG: M23 family metallopeptidase [Micropepsaceae bacterium]